MLVELHLIQNHAPANLNRDDTGSPKECVFGNVKRARISSQCLKRAIRRSDLFSAELEGHLATRTRNLPEMVRQQLLDNGISTELAAIAAKKASGFGTKDGKEQDSLKTAQTMFLTSADIEAVVATLENAAGEAGSVKDFQELKAKDLQIAAQQKGFRPISVDIGLFGRMTTSGAFRDVEAACQVAHALSTHKVDHEYDYFTAVDDLKDIAGDEEQDSGADMLGDVEFNSSCYYKYFSIDVQGLVDNLTGTAIGRTNIPAEELAEAQLLATRALTALLRAAILTTPSGKQNSFAAHQLPAAILVEVRPVCTPVSYANAFVKPARAESGNSLIDVSLEKLKNHVTAISTGFNLPSSARLLLAPEYPDFEIPGVERVNDLNTLCTQLGTVIR